MEMESSRRSMDRSREPGLKKPRLVEEAERDRGLNGVVDRERPMERQVQSAGQLLSRFRANERERDATTAGVQQQQQQLQELVSQYKTALGELTFNSKPIITNLTIIAGENTHAAKGIAATVCSNIIEVPREQKLPSLYLLDSIVKNIGGDYVKHFAARLPEVFCRAYREVDPSIHPGMQHLFRTWRGVFPTAPLEVIEQQLDFPPATTSRSDSQPQRPAHSIHVNPKYLEARQRLQQSSRVKGIGIDSTGSSSIEDVERPERMAIIGGPKPRTDLKIHSIKHPQREKLNEPVHEKKPGAGYGDYRFGSDCARSSDLGIGRGDRITERGVEKPWYGLESSSTNTTAGQRNGYDMPQFEPHGPLVDAYGNHRAPKPTRAVAPLQPTQNVMNRSSRGAARNWKNSEEEEYLWDDMNSRLSDNGETDSLRKDGWNPDDAEKRACLPRANWMPLETDTLDTGWNTLDTLSRLEKPTGGDDRIPLQREVEDHLQHRGQQDVGSRGNRETSTDTLSVGQGVQSAFGHRTVSGWPPQEPNLPLRGDSLNHIGVSPIVSGQSDGPSRTGLGSHISPSPVGSPSSFGSLPHPISGSAGIFGHQWQHPQRPPSPSAPPSLHHRPHSPSSSSVFHQHKQPHNLTDHDHPHSLSLSQLGHKASQLVGQFNRVPLSQVSQESLPIMPPNNIQPGSLRNLQVSHSQSPQHYRNAPSSLLPSTHQSAPVPFLQQLQPELLLQQMQSHPSGLAQKPLPQPPNLRTSQALSYSESSFPKTHGADLPGQSKMDNQSSPASNLPSLTSSFPNPSFPDSTMQSHLNILPPLSSGPPPIQLTPLAYRGNLHAFSTPALRAMQPPLPPGPPPASSLVGASLSQASSRANSVPNPLSSLLSSLVAKGLISAPTTNTLTLNPPDVPPQLQKQNTSVVTSPPMLASSSSVSATLPPSSANKLPSLEPASKATPSQVAAVDIDGPIGIEFNQELIREFHPHVISRLFDDLQHQCSICGLRFKLQEQLSGHLDWHASKKHEQCSGKSVLRQWYASLCDWVSGNVGSLCGPGPTTSVEETVILAEKCEPVVPADESQSICTLCGELFEEFYSDERDEWMYKGAVYMSLPAEEGVGSMDSISSQGPIVHVNCISEGSVDELGLGMGGYSNLDHNGG